VSGTARIIQADAMDLPVPDSSVDLVITSPPYFGLRSYQDNGEHYAGQIGAEATPVEFVDALIAATREMVRVLKPSGSIWVNLGDRYDKDKSLMDLPHRYAIRCRDELRLIKRAEVIWCLSGGARVYARINGKDRPVVLRDLARSYKPESVQFWNGQQWTQVLGWNKTPDDDGALEFELRTGERIGCTPGHQWPTERGLLRADEIRVGDVIETTTLPSPEHPRTPALLPDYDTGWLVGLYIAEGSRSGRTVQFAGHLKETLRHARLTNIAAALDGNASVYQTSDNGATCNLTGSVIEGVIDRYVSAGTAKTKRLTVAAWQRNNDFLAGVVEGYLEGDGHYDGKNDRWRLGFTANDEWSADIRTLAARLGAKISLRRAVHTGNYGTFPGWRGEWRWTRSAHRNVRPDGQVVAVRASRARDFYDVGVADEPHLFALASGVLTHNSKPNGLPESVTDRVRRSHETWFHFTKSPRYFAAVDEIREEHNERRPTRDGRNNVVGVRDAPGVRANEGTAEQIRNPLGKLPGSVRTVPTQPLRIPPEVGVQHFAAFPMEWPRWIIAGWSPSGICTACGEGRRPVSERKLTVNRGGRQSQRGSSAVTGGSTGQTLGFERTVTITGYACACPDVSAPTRPSVVLDPFGGTGTTALMAMVMGRDGVSVDLSGDYCRAAEWRTTDPKERAKAEKKVATHG
jgi:hypothetical protein